MSISISASVARQTLPTQLDRVEAGEEVAITRHGRVVAVLVRPDVLTARRAPEAWNRADRIGALLESARSAPLRPPAISPERAEELVEAVRADRSAR
ncbi:type II toxin-antitoxin system prevent-host-death family antitoxin [Raineyella sp. W15-4]|uniref:type II toxin-antitoxin system Phd/YefM family antitoxin n=1 Tax=Raineyella sp. W15-4 TaxID=3081651 RepID=UPI0029538FFA|nr:type II toxin-antitoxin system prevent-host-death family antitoxin [Raineyella sp. W15-4]WOQ15716.1 type II toxin-antitoxin system prevent-host-death family antitoxin [Raineyella sp. W15-4]